MSNGNEKEAKKGSSLKIRVRRARSRMVAGLKTGSHLGSLCTSRTDPTDNGYTCFSIIPSKPVTVVGCGYR
jgi:hypothetical protein